MRTRHCPRLPAVAVHRSRQSASPDTCWHDRARAGACVACDTHGSTARGHATVLGEAVPLRDDIVSSSALWPAQRSSGFTCGQSVPRVAQAVRHWKGGSGPPRSAHAIADLLALRALERGGVRIQSSCSRCGQLSRRLRIERTSTSTGMPGMRDVDRRDLDGIPSALIRAERLSAAFRLSTLRHRSAAPSFVHCGRAEP